MLYLRQIERFKVNSIELDLIERKLTQGEIAKKHGVSIRTIGRIAKAKKLGIGQGKKYIWEFSGSSPELCYLIGAYITDGCITFDYKSRVPTTMKIGITDVSFRDAIRSCLDAIGLHFSVAEKNYQDMQKTTHKGKKTIYETSCHVRDFSIWLNEVCGYKEKIPDFIFSSPIEDKVAFICGAIDGDGCVTKEGSISIGCIDNWITHLPELAETIGVKPSLRTEIMPSGKVMYKVSLKRSDFRALNPTCHIAHKQERLLYAKDERKRRNQKRPSYSCNVCGELKRKNKEGEMCQDCYIKSDKFYEHLKKIAPIGNKAGNKARWGYEG